MCQAITTHLSAFVNLVLKIGTCFLSKAFSTLTSNFERKQKEARVELPSRESQKLSLILQFHPSNFSISFKTPGISYSSVAFLALLRFLQCETNTALHGLAGRALYNFVHPSSLLVSQHGEIAWKQIP